MLKFADYPVELWDVYGCERHPEFVPYSGGWIQETYADRRKRAEIFALTASYFEGGVLPEKHIILIDEDQPEEVWEEYGTQYYPDYSLGFQKNFTECTSLYGRRSQAGFVIAPDGKIVVAQVWERPAQIDEVLSYIFGLEPGLEGF